MLLCVMSLGKKKQRNTWNWG